MRIIIRLVPSNTVKINNFKLMKIQIPDYINRKDELKDSKKSYSREKIACTNAIESVRYVGRRT